MKSDISKLTFKPGKHFSSVRLQQGRVQLDSDWNEQADIQTHHRRAAVGDLIEPSGAPRENPGFGVSVNADAADLLIGPGRMYVDGLLCENEAEFRYSEQSEYPGAPAVTDPGLYLAYLEIHERSVTSLEDPSIREKSLGGPDTTTRVQTLRQVKLLPVTEPTPAPGEEALTRITIPPEWTQLITRRRGLMRALTEADGATVSPCEFGARGGYLGAENRLYRVEIHYPGGPGTATFKWSRDNASFATKLLRQDGNLLTVENAGQDETKRFVPSGWIEVIDERLELQGRPGTLLQITHVQGKGLTFKADNVIHHDRDSRDPAMTEFDINEFDPETRKVRRWDMSDVRGEVLVPAAGGVIELEDGISVEFESDAAAPYRTGDAWMIPARTATGNIEWPCDKGTNLPALVLPYGDDHHFTRLAFIRRLADGWSQAPEDLIDCREFFSGMIYKRKRPPESMSHTYFPHGLEQNEIDKFPNEDLMADVRTIQDALDRLFDKKVNKTGDVINGPLEVVGDLIIKGELMARAEENLVGRVSLGDDDGDSVTIHGYITSNHSEGHLRLEDSLHITENLIVDGNNHATNPESEYLARFSGPGDFAVGDAATPRDRLVIKDDGRVGMGVPAPEARLHLGGDMKIDGPNTLEFGAGEAGKEPDAGKIGYRALSTDALDITGAGDDATTRKIKFWNEGSASFTGNVGIGLDGPVKTFEVAGDARIQSNLGFGAVGPDGEGDAGLIRADDPEGFHVQGATGRKLTLGANAEPTVHIDTEGKVGVGIPEPAAKLHVGTHLSVVVNDDLALRGEVAITDKPYDVAVVGAHAYVANDAGLRVVDISDPSAPRVVGSYDTPSSARSLAASPGLVMLGDYANGLLQFDVTDPINPVLVQKVAGVPHAPVDVQYVGKSTFVVADFNNTLHWVFAGLSTVETVDIGVFINTVHIDGTLAYTANHIHGFRITDVSDRSAPVLLGQVDIPFQSHGAWAADGYGYVARGNGITIIDVNDPARPTIVGEYFSGGEFRRVVVRDGIMYAICRAYGLTGLHIVDVSNPAAPVLLEHFANGEEAMDVTLVGDSVYLVTGDNGLKIYDKGEEPKPLSAVFDGSVGIGTATPAATLHVVGKTTTIITPPTDPVPTAPVTLIGNLDLDGKYTVFGSATGDRGYVGTYNTQISGSQFSTLDLSDPANPQVLGQYENFAGIIDKFVVQGNYAYCAWGQVGLVILDISDPANIQPMIHYGDAGWTSDIAFVDASTVVITTRTFGVQMINISDPITPTRLGQYSAGAHLGGGIFVDGSLAYYADLEAGLKILDTSNPSQLHVPVGELVLPHGLRRVVVHNQHAYVAGGPSGLLTIDVSNPAAPVLVDQIPLADVLDVAIYDDRLYVAAGTQHLIVYDISSPSPNELLRYGTPGRAYGIDFADDGSLLLAEAEEGLSIYSFDASALPSGPPAPSDPTLLVDLYTGFLEGQQTLYATDRGDLVFTGSFESNRFGQPTNYFKIIDIADPANPQLVAEYVKTSGGVNELGSIQKFVVRSDIAFLAFEDRGLVILHLGNSAITELAHMVQNNYRRVFDLALVNDYVYTATDTLGLQAIDISDLNNPTIIGALVVSSSTPGANAMFGVTVEGSLAYVTGNFGFAVVDISNPAAPALRGMTMSDQINLWRVAYHNQHVYIAGQSSGLHTVDVSDPDNPTLIDTIPFSDARDVSIRYGRLYVAARADKMIVYDISTDPVPSQLFTDDPAGESFGVSVTQYDRIYLANGNSGIRVYTAPFQSTPAPAPGPDPVPQSTTAVGTSAIFSGSVQIQGLPGTDGLTFPDGTHQTTAGGGGGGDSLPLGTIMAWHKDMAGTPSIPAGWVECNGQTLEDPASPYDGEIIPNLNGDPAGADSPNLATKKSMFLRGGLTSGTGQDDAFQGHWHYQDQQVSSNPGDRSHAMPGGGAWGHNSHLVRDPRNDGTNGEPRTADETRPTNMSVVWIMKVKQVADAQDDDTVWKSVPSDHAHTDRSIGIGTSTPLASLHIGGSPGVDGIMFPDGTLQTTAGGGGDSTPLGTIMAWHKSMAGTPAIPEGWVECNGQTLNDPDSPYNGQIIPNLNNQLNSWNTKGSFLRGSTSSGAFEHDTFQAHRHRVYPHAGFHGGPQTGAHGGDTGYRVHNETTSGPTPEPGVSGPRADHETRPANMSVVWIMKVKQMSGDPAWQQLVDGLAYTGGNVGIGTTAPGAKLHIEGQAGIDGLMFPDGTLQTTAGGGGGDSTPIGTIMAWHKSLTGTPAIPAGWVECNGQALNDPTSPYHGQIIPNLNGDPAGENSPDLGDKKAMFLRGGLTSGTGQDDAFQDHGHNLQIHSDPNNPSGQPYYLRGIGGGQHTNSSSGSVTTPRNYGTGQPRTDSETRPVNMTVVWIMKVKKVISDSESSWQSIDQSGITFSNDRIGIGTETPNASLEVIGQSSGGGAPVNPGQLTNEGKIDHSNWSFFASARGDHAFVTRGAEFTIVDVSDPTQAVIAGQYNGPADCLCFAVNENIAYVCFGTTMHILDISDPANPTLLSQPGAGNTLDIAYSGDHVYFVNSSGALQILNVADPANPLPVGTVGTVGNALVQGIAVEGDFAYVSSVSAFQVFDVSNPAAPQLRGQFANSSGIGARVAVHGSYAYLAQRSEGLVVVDISNPDAPAQSGVGTGSDNAGGMAIAHGLLYLADYANLNVYDLSTAPTPGHIATYPTDGNSVHVALSDRGVFAAMFGGLQIFTYDGGLINSLGTAAILSGDLRITGTPGVHGIEFPDGTRQTTAGGGGGDSTPIGTIMAWHKSLTGTPAIPAGWAECNGQVLNDTNSPYNGQIIPNLNGDPAGADSPDLGDKKAMFLRGGLTSGTGQDDAFQEHRHPNALGHNVVGPYITKSPPAGGGTGLVGSDVGANVGSMGTGDGRTDSETRPTNMSVVWIMKVKLVGAAGGEVSALKMDGLTALSVAGNGNWPHPPLSAAPPTATGALAVAMGLETQALTYWSVAMGERTVAEATAAVAMGHTTRAAGAASVVMGVRMTTEENYSVAMGQNGQVGAGSGTMLGVGYNPTPASGSGDQNLIFKVHQNGNGYFDGAADVGAADYAEYFETDDGKEIQPGYFVSFAEHDRIRSAKAGDDILGIVSAAPGVVGDSAWANWSGRYQRDEFDRYIYEDVEVTDETTGEKRTERHRVEVDGFDPKKSYVPRADRPEWVPVGLLGKLYVHTASKTLKPGDYVTSNDEGKAVKVKKGQKGWRVLSVKPEHKLVRVMFRS